MHVINNSVEFWGQLCTVDNILTKSTDSRQAVIFFRNAFLIATMSCPKNKALLDRESFFKTPHLDYIIKYFILCYKIKCKFIAQSFI